MDDPLLNFIIVLVKFETVLKLESVFLTIKELASLRESSLQNYPLSFSGN